MRCYFFIIFLHKYTNTYTYSPYKYYVIYENNIEKIFKELSQKLIYNSNYKDVDPFEGIRDKMLPRDKMPSCACLYEDAPLCTLFTDARYVLCLYSAPLSIKMKALMRRDARGTFPRILTAYSNPYFDCYICNCREGCKRLIMDRLRNTLLSYYSPNRRFTIRAMISVRINQIGIRNKSIVFFVVSANFLRAS